MTDVMTFLFGVGVGVFGMLAAIVQAIRWAARRAKPPAPTSAPPAMIEECFVVAEGHSGPIHMKLTRDELAHFRAEFSAFVTFARERRTQRGAAA